jgi:hypothetical protein
MRKRFGKELRLFICLIMSQALASTPIVAQTPSAVSIHLRVVSGATVEVTETNTSAKEIRFDCKPNMKIHVVKADGSSAEDTDEGMKYKADERSGSTNRQTMCVVVSLSPAQTVKYPMDISRYYKMNATEQYTVSIEQTIEGSSPAKSNAVSLSPK